MTLLRARALSGSSNATRLPEEIWNECWRRSRTRELRSLISVCRLFYRLCRPYLHESHSFFAPNPCDIFRHEWRVHAANLDEDSRHLTWLAQSNGQFVRRIEFHGSNELDLTWRWRHSRPLLDAYIRAEKVLVHSLPLFINLQSLQISEVTVDLPLMQAISTLQHCKIFELSFLEDVRFDLPAEHDVKLEIPNVHFHVARRPPEDDLRAGSSLSFLSPNSLDSLVLVHFKVAHGFLLASRIMGSWSRLAKLEVTVPAASWDDFIRFLESCPNIHSLDMSYSSSLPKYQASLPASTLPLLHTYRGHLKYVPVFVPNHHVAEVDVSNCLVYDGGDPSCEALLLAVSQCAQSTAVVHRLDLPETDASIELVEHINFILPDLEILSLTFYTLPYTRLAELKFGYNFDSDDDDDDNSSLSSDSSLTEDDLDEADQPHIEVDHYSSDSEESTSGDDSASGSSMEEYEPLHSTHGNTVSDAPYAEVVEQEPDESSSRESIPHLMPQPDPDNPVLTIPSISDEEHEEYLAPAGRRLGHKKAFPVAKEAFSIPVDEQGNPTRDPHTYSGLMDYILLGRVSLPRRLRQLKIAESNGGLPEYTREEHCRAVLELSNKHPDLDFLEIGSNCEWETNLRGEWVKPRYV